MSEKAIVVQGAICTCQFGTVPDKLKVLSHSKEYANDESGSDKLIATTKEVGKTFQANCFGVCPKLGSPPPPCQVVVTEWQDYYEEVILSNGGKILIETSKATCPIGGAGCISILHHGQIGVPSQQNFDNAHEDVQGQLNPMVSKSEMSQSESNHSGLTSK